MIVEHANQHQRKCWMKWEERARQSGEGTFLAAVIEYAEHWAYLIEREMRCGLDLEQAAQKTTSKAYGGYEYGNHSELLVGAAVLVLLDSWKHGRRLHNWYNSTLELLMAGKKLQVA